MNLKDWSSREDRTGNVEEQKWVRFYVNVLSACGILSNNETNTTRKKRDEEGRGVEDEI